MDRLYDDVLNIIYRMKHEMEFIAVKQQLVRPTRYMWNCNKWVWDKEKGWVLSKVNICSIYCMHD